jgi:hypothetical protein
LAGRWVSPQYLFFLVYWPQAAGERKDEIATQLHFHETFGPQTALESSQ